MYLKHAKYWLFASLSRIIEVPKSITSRFFVHILPFSISCEPSNASKFKFCISCEPSNASATGSQPFFKFHHAFWYWSLLSNEMRRPSHGLRNGPWHFLIFLHGKCSGKKQMCTIVFVTFYKKLFTKHEHITTCLSKKTIFRKIGPKSTITARETHNARETFENGAHGKLFPVQ